MEKKRGLRLSYRVLIVVTIIVFTVGIYNLIAFLGGLGGSSISPKLTKDEVTGDWKLAFGGNPRNNGILDVSLSFEITIFDVNGRIVATNSTTVLVRPGSSQTFSMIMTIPSEMVPGGKIEEAKGFFEMKMAVRELGGLMGLTQIMKVGSG